MLSEYKIKLENLNSKLKEFSEILEIEQKRKSMAELEKQTLEPKFWNDSNKAKEVLKELKSKEKIVKQWENIRNKIEDLLVLISAASENEVAEFEKEIKPEISQIEQEFSSLEIATLFSGEYDLNNAILSINAGAGGTDAQDWAQILLRMYSRFCESKEFQVELVDMSYGEEAGVKGVTIIVSGPHAYGYLKTENGIHRLVRMSPFNSDGKRHTSFASVEVIPEINQEANVEINPNDLRIDTYRASGPGGQHVNKTDSAIRITHIPTGIVAQSQSARSQHANREAAMKIVKARLHEEMMKQNKIKIEELKGEKREIAWGNQIRSYVFAPYTMAKDHRTSVELSDINKVIDGYIEPFIEAALKVRNK